MAENKIAIIPARGGSKRIPRKNIKEFLGKPIIAYSIEAALSSNLFDEVMVSTDDDEIKNIALEYGAKVPFLRSGENSNDFATTLNVIEEVIDEYSKIGKAFTHCCCLYPAAPLVTPVRLRAAFNLLVSHHLDTVFPVMQFSSPIQRALKLNANGRAEFIHPEFSVTRTQDLEPAFYDAGQFYWMNLAPVLRQKKILTDNTGIVEIKVIEGQDIDSLEDWIIAELKYKISHEGKL